MKLVFDHHHPYQDDGYVSENENESEIGVGVDVDYGKRWICIDERKMNERFHFDY